MKARFTKVTGCGGCLFWLLISSTQAGPWHQWHDQFRFKFNIVANGHGTFAIAGDLSALVQSAPLTATALEIVQQPKSAKVTVGARASLTVIASGSEPLGYQWQKDGNPIPNATSTTLVLEPVQLSDAGVYTVVVSNGSGSVTSQPATLLVRTAPAIAQQPQSTTATVGARASFAVMAFGSEPLNFQWQKDGTPIPNATSATLVLEPVQLSDAGSYTVVVNNASGSVTSQPATLVVAAATMPTISRQPQSATVTVGGRASFTVIATGSEPFTYQWQKDNNPIPNATSATLVLEPVLVSDAGSYIVVVSNTAGSETSQSANLVVATATAPAITQQPRSGKVTVGARASLTVIATGSEPLNYQWQKDGIPIPNATSATLVLEPVQLSDAGVYTVVVSNAESSVTSQPATLLVRPAPAIAQQPQSTTVTVGANASFTVIALGSEPLNYQWQKDGNPIPNATSATLVLESVQLSDAGAYTVVVNNASGSVTSQAATLVIPTVPTIAQQPQNTTVPVGGRATFSVSASGSDPLKYQWKKDGDAIANATSATLVLEPVQLSDVGSYTVVVTSAAGSVTSQQASLVIATAPTITQQQLTTTVPVGASISFMVVASGTESFNYQWLKDGHPIANATSATLVLDSVQLSDSGAYAVVVSNAAGSVTNQSATLVVTQPVTQPQTVSLAIQMIQGNIGLSVTGTVGKSYRIEYVNDLPNDNNNWNALATVTLPTSPYLWIDAGSSSVEKRFYRAVLLP